MRSFETLRKLDALPRVVALKDSSANDAFFSEILRRKDELNMSILQGMEHKLLESKGCDGYLIALGNIEPQLAKAMFEHPTAARSQQILEKFWEYNLGGEWYVSLKALLYSRGIIRSAEQVKQAIKI